MQDVYSRPAPSRFSANERPLTGTRRMADQDVVLPSVERETVALTSPRGNTNEQHPVQNHSVLGMQKRKADEFFSDEREPQAEQYTKRPRPMRPEGVYPRANPVGAYEYHSSPQLGPRSIPRPPPPPEHVVDLTSSPDGPPSTRREGYYPLPRSVANVDPRGYVYAPPVPYGLPTRDVRGPHYQVPAGEPHHTYVPNVRAYDGRAPVHGHVSLPHGRQASWIEPYARAGARYGA